MKFFFSILIAIAFSIVLSGEPAESQRVAHYNLDKSNLALQGYDPVSYFQDGPIKGKPSINAAYHGVTYYFANEANKKSFESEPGKYEPAYGGWCATALLEGTKYKIDPKNYKIVDGHNLLFYKGFLGDALKDWNKKIEQGQQEPDLVAKAATEWEKHLAK